MGRDIELDPAPELRRPNEEELDGLVDYWEAANYLTVAQIYLQANPLLREPLRPEHVKPRLLGHWGTSPGLNLVYAQLNRLIRATGDDVLFVAGPGHGGPAVVANVYLEGTYSEVYPEVSADTAGLLRLVRQFSTPGGIPSHVSVPTPGSIHEGGELGYALVHAFGAAFDNPDLLVACVIGDGEAETAPLEGSWKGVRFLNPARDGAVLPILHLNQYKISGPTVLGRASEEEIASLLAGHGYEARFVSGTVPREVHREFATTLAECRARIAAIQAEARAGGVGRPRWPAIVLRTPKGWTGPARVDGVQIEGTFRAHQVPLGQVRENPEHLAMLEAWMRSYRPEERFDSEGRLVPGLAALALTQVAYGGLLFAFTLYLQLGLGQSALRAALTYLPMAVTFGLSGFYWRRLPARAAWLVVPAGLTVSVVAYLGIAASVRSGADASAWAWMIAVGLGLGLSVSPLLTRSLANVPASRAADASGLLTTTVQLGQLMGVAVIGSVYLSRAQIVPEADSVAMSVAAYWLAALSAAGLLATVMMIRATRNASPRP